MPIITLDQKLAEWFNNLSTNGWNWGNLILCVVSIILTVVFCSLIGLEREKRGRSAGLRTHLLVGLGSCVVMIISIYGFPLFGANRDVSRLAAQVVSGVGFLGAGAIIHNSNGGIKGLTTASTIWITMAIGLACGSMNFILAFAATLITMLVLVAFRVVENKANRNNPSMLIIVKEDLPVVSILIDVAEKTNCIVADIVTSSVRNGIEPCTQVTFKMYNRTKDPKVTEQFIEILKEKTQPFATQIVNLH